MGDFLLSQAEIDALLPQNNAPQGKGQAKAAPAGQAAAETYTPQQLGRILELPMQLTAILGQTSKTLGEVLAFSTGSIVEFGHDATKPLDICLGGRLLARGKVIIVEEHFAVKITEVVSPAERAHQMGEQV